MNPQGTKLDLAWLGESWKILTSRMGEFIGMSVISAVIFYAIYFVIQIPMNIVASMMQEVSLFAVFGTFAISMFGQFLAQGVMYVLYGGMMIFALKLIRGEPAKFEDLFIGFKNFGAFFVAGILIGLATGIGFLFCCIPGFVVGGLLMFTFPLIYDRNLSAMAAVQESIRLLKDQWAMALAYYFVAYLFSLVGIVALCIGVIVTLPLLYISMTVAYHKIVGGATEPFLSPSQYPRNPGDAANMPAAPSAWPTETPAPAPAPAPETPAPAPTHDPEPPAASVWGDTMAEGAEPAANSPWTGDPAPAADPSATVGEAPAAPAPSVDSDATAGEAPAVSGWGEPVPDPSATVGEAPAVEDHRPDDNPPRPQ